MDELNKSISEITKEVAKPFYNDAVSPAAKEFGKGLTSIARILNAGVYLAEDCATTLVHVLRKSGEQLCLLPPERICLDKPRVSASAIEQSRFAINENEIQELFANLIASSMDKNRVKYAHPAYIEIIRQLESDEAKIIKYMDSLGGKAPTIELIKETDRDKHGMISITETFSDINLIAEDAACEYPENEITYFENLKRLGLIASSSGTSFVQGNEHERIFNSEKTEKHKQLNPHIKNARFNSTMFVLTTFGQGFVQACLNNTLNK